MLTLFWSGEKHRAHPVWPLHFTEKVKVLSMESDLFEATHLRPKITIRDEGLGLTSLSGSPRKFTSSQQLRKGAFLFLIDTIYTLGAEVVFITRSQAGAAPK